MQTLFDDTDLFSSGESKIKKFDIPDAELTLYEHFFNREESDHFYKALLSETPWQQRPITVYDKTHLTPRLTVRYGKNRQGEAVLPLTETLKTIQGRVEGATGSKFTSVLANLYRDGRDGVAWHRDNEREYGQHPIGSVSFGETRPFQIRHKFRKELEKVTIPLEHGSFLLMAGPMQQFWEHQIPKTSKDIKPRINLTFRVVE